MFSPSNGNKKPTNSNGESRQQQQQQQKPERSKHIEVCVRLRPLSVRSHLSSSSFFHKQPAQRGSSSGLRAPTSHRSGIPSRSTAAANSSTPRKPAIPKFRGNANATPPQPEQQQQNPNETRYAWDVIGPGTVSQEPSSIVPGRTHQYTLDRVYGPTTTTASVYDQSVRDLVLAAMEGYHTAVLAYGQTSTGKTHTMTGTAQEPGLIPLAVRECFAWLSSAKNAAQQEREYLLRVSYLEVYKEHIKDLLATTVEPIRLFEHAKQGLVIRGLKEEVVTSPHQVFSLLAAGEARRHTGATQLNQHSSRSHVMVRLWIESKASCSNGKPKSSSVRISSLSLVDLAGSESVRLTGSTERQAEGHYINKSLMTLGKVVYALSVDGQSGQQHVPYRDSKLTRLLQPSLSGSAQVVLVCCISPLASHVEESHNTFKFAIRAKKIPQKAVIHEEDGEDKTTLLQSYRDEIEDLKQQLQEAQQQLQQPQDNTNCANDAEVVVEEEMHDLIQAIQTMEKLILKTKPLETTAGGDETVATATSMMESDSVSLAADISADNNNDNSMPSLSSPDMLTPNLQSELTRIQNMLGTVLAKRHSSATTLRDLRAQLEEQEVTGTLLSADASFLQQSLIEKDALLADVSKLLADVEERQIALETENRMLRRELAALRPGGEEL